MNRGDIEIGASEAAAPLGLSSFETPLAYYAKKIRAADPREETEATRLGKVLEPVLARMFEEEFDVPLRKAETLYHPSFPWLRSTEDYYFVTDDAPAKLREEMSLEDGEHVIVELKTAGIATTHMRERIDAAWGEPGSDHVPAEYATQVQTQILTRNAILQTFGDGFCTRAFIKSMIGGRGGDLGDCTPTYKLLGRPDVHGFITGELERFVEQHLVPEVPPAPVDLADWEMLEGMVRSPNRTKSLRQPTQDELRVVAGWRMAKVAREQAELIEQQCRVMLIGTIGRDYGFEGPWGRVLYTLGQPVARTAKAGAFDAVMALLDGREGALVDQIRAIRDLYTKPGYTGRQLRPTWRDEGTEKK